MEKRWDCPLGCRVLTQAVLRWTERGLSRDSPGGGAHEAGLGLDLCHWGPMTGPWKAQGQGQWRGLAPGPPRVEEEEAGSRAGEGRGAWCRGEGAFNYFWFLITIYNTF